MTDHWTGSRGEFPVVEGFTLVRRIASGGYSSVFEARQQDVDAPVALKVLEGAYDDRSRVRFERECQSMGRLRDEAGIVTVYRATYTADGRPVIVMAYLSGGSLADRVAEQGPLPVDVVLAIADTMTHALQAAHDAGIYHRDLKPENILIDRNGRPALTDFGIAKIAGEATSTETAASLTPAHAPPERYTSEGEPEDPVRGDVYSLASTFYTLLGGRPPHGTARDTGGIAGLMDRILYEPVPRLQRDDVPVSVIDALDHALRKEPNERPVDVTAFRNELLAGEAVAPDPVASATGAGETTGAGLDETIRLPRSLGGGAPPPPSAPPVAAGPPPSGPRPRRRRVLAIAAALAVALVAGAAGVYATRDSGGSQPCAHGVPFAPPPSKPADGTVIEKVMPDDTEHVGVIAAGALFGFSIDTDFNDTEPWPRIQPVDDATYDAIAARRPRPDVLLATGATASQPERQLFLTAGGALFPLGKTTGDTPAVPDAVRSFGAVQKIPPNLVSSAQDFFLPPGGSLLHVAGSSSYWLVNGKARQLATPCGDANKVELPDVKGILGQIPKLYG